MNLYEIERLCRFYQKAKMFSKEKQLLQATLSNPEFSNWQWGIKRMREFDPGFIIPSKTNDFSEEKIIIEPDITPTTREKIIQYSYQYQREWRFEREKRLIQYGLTLFPDWKYLHDRMEWHSRPIFHHEPEKSKTQPRNIVYADRDLQYTPTNNTLNNMCFVTAGSHFYFWLIVQLLESIKATKYYSNIPIKIIDAGLYEEQKEFLIKKFNAQIKDPG